MLRVSDGSRSGGVFSHHHFYVPLGRAVRASFPPVMGPSAPGKGNSSVAAAYEKQMLCFACWFLEG